MSIGKKIKEAYKFFDVDKRSIWGNYHIERKVFLITFLALLFLLGSALMESPANKLIYVNCPLGSVTQVNGLMFSEGCLNPFYNKCNQDIVPCKQKILMSGSTYGEPFELPHFIKYFWLYCLIIVGFGFLYNHLIYNTKYGVKKC